MNHNYFFIKLIKCILLIPFLSFGYPSYANSLTAKIDNVDNFVEVFYSDNGYNWDSPGIGAAKLGTGGTIRLVQSLWWGQMYESSHQAGFNTSSLKIPKAILDKYGHWFKDILINANTPRLEKFHKRTS